MASHNGVSKIAKSAVLAYFVTCLILVIAFSTNSWLETDGELENPRFIKLGLWNVCLKNFKDIKYLYDRVFNGCRHILDEEYHFLDSFLRPRGVTRTNTTWALVEIKTVRRRAAV